MRIEDLQPGIYDLNQDGRMDSLLFEWNGRKALFLSDQGELPWASYKEKDWNQFFNQAFCVGSPEQNPWNEVRSSWGSYTLLVDKNRDGRFDSPDDYCYRAFDINGDGAPEAEYYHLFPGEAWCPYSNKLHIGLSGDPRMSYLNFETLTYSNEQAYDEGFEYRMNVQGSGFFLNSYSAHPDCSWETPIAWYDMNKDGCPEMTMRVGDTFCNAIIQSGGLAEGQERYSGKVSEFELSYELNGNTGTHRRHSLDMQLTFYDYEHPSLDYMRLEDRPGWLSPLAGSEWVHGCMASVRLEPVRRYLPYMDGCQIGMEHPDWAGVYLLFDEDDDDCRWEEMFSAHEDECEHANPGWGRCADKIGDRTERDLDFGGRGLLYRGAFDGRIHLFHAEEGIWDVDYLGLYKGSVDHAECRSEGPEPPEGLWYPRVYYIDEDGDGVIDTIRYCKTAYGYEDTMRKVLRTVHLAQYYEGGRIPKPALFDPRAAAEPSGWKLENWDGTPLTEQDFEGTPVKACYDRMSSYYDEVCDAMWRGAQLLYQAAKRHGLNVSEQADAELRTDYSWEELLSMKELTIPEGYSRHLHAGNRREKYHNGFWLREKVFEDICQNSQLDKFRLETYYYTGRYEELSGYLDEQLGDGICFTY